jgi:hypothetical protein
VQAQEMKLRLKSWNGTSAGSSPVTAKNGGIAQMVEAANHKTNFRLSLQANAFTAEHQVKRSKSAIVGYWFNPGPLLQMQW